MEITWEDLKIDTTSIDFQSLVESWVWLIGTNKRPILISSIGDLFLSDNDDNCFWLNVGEGTIEKISSSIEEFKSKLNDEEQVNEWFLPELVAQIKLSGLELCYKKLFSYKKLPVLGGEYIPENFELFDVEVHFGLNGDIHRQIKDLPDGTKVNFKIED